MERVLLTTMVWAISIVVSFAAPVSEQAAMIAAQKFIHQQLPAMSRGERIELTRAFTDVADGEGAGIYVFNTTNGYVVVSADDHLPEILAYGNGAPYDATKASVGMKAMLDAYHHIAISQTSSKADVQIHDDVAPFITTKWNQMEPYNVFCPATLSKGVCPTGCVATAMAQVMYYYQHPANYEWDKMKTTYSASDSGESVNAVAQLMVDCGTASFMNYDVDGSGTNDIYACEALRYDFGYAETTEFVERECYTTVSWDALIYNEISAKRPVMYGALSASSGQGITGHEFIIDGYEVKSGIGYYHVNWGWGGYSDDYFLLSILNPDYQYTGGNAGSSGYSFTQSAIIGIMPAKKPMDKTTRAYIGNIYIKNDSVNFTRSSTSENFPAINLGFSFYNLAKPEMDREYDVAVALYKDRDLIEILDQTSLNDIFDKQLEYMTGKGLTCDSIVFGKNLTDGKYQIRVLSRETGTMEWAWAINSACRYVELTIAGTMMTTITYGGEVEADECNFTINSVEWSESPRMGKPMMITINLTDNNKTSNSPIFLWGSASMSLGKNKYQLLTGGGTNLDPGETGDIVLEYTPQRSGSFTFILSGSSENCNKPLYTFKVEVAAESIADVDISVKLSADDAVRQLGKPSSVQGNVLKGTAKLTNNGTEAYDNNINVVLYESEIGKSYSYKALQTSLVSIGIGEQCEVGFSFENLTTNFYYAIVIYAYERGESKALNLINDKLDNSSIFYMIGSESGIDSISVDGNNEGVYTLHGVKIGKYSELKNLPKGIYIVNNQKILNY